MNQKFLTTGEIAQYCQVTHRTVLKWITDGKIQAFRTPGNHSRVNINDFISFLQYYKMPIPEHFLPHVEVRKKILIVEDDPSVVKVINAIFAKEKKYHIQITYDGFAAGLLFYEFKPDLVTLDINMPLVDGYEVCSRIRSNPFNDHVKIIVIFDAEDKIIDNIRKLGVDAFLRKPVSKKALLDTVQQLYP